MNWQGSNQYSFNELDIGWMRETFPHLPSRDERQALDEALGGFINGLAIQSFLLDSQSRQRTQ
jgi:hypothetical protein